MYTIENQFDIFIEKRRPYVRLSTLSCHIQTYKRIKGRDIVRMNIEEIRSRDLQHVVEDMFNESKYSKKTIRDTIGLIKCIINWATEYYELPARPLRVRFPEEYGQKEGVEVFMVDEQRKIAEHCFKNPHPQNIAILLSLLTGMRIGEICALTWDDIDTVNRIIHVRKSCSRVELRGLMDVPEKTRLMIGPTKTRSSNRSIPMPKWLNKFLCQARGVQPEEWFVASASSVPIEPRTLRPAYRTILLQLGIPYRKFHALRHSFATTMIRSGCDVMTVSRLLGHSEISMTLDTYSHATEESKIAAMGSMSKTLFKKKPDFLP